MPNHVSNRVTITGPADRVVEFFERAKRDDSPFSFGGFIPPPDHPDYKTGNCGHSHHNFKGQEDPHKNCWYPWNIANWGTKWGAYDVVVGNMTVLDRLAGLERLTNHVSFDTAWSPPMPVYEKMIDLYPDCTIEILYMDEDMTGSGGGIIRVENGEVVQDLQDINDPDDPDTGELWWKLVSTLKGYTKEHYEELLAERAEDERLMAEEQAKAAQ